MTQEKYWTVIMEVFAFDTEDEAREYAQRLLDEFCEDKGNADRAASVRVREDEG